jgi:septal ring factor EnvC (AmiA/AmiB activator)
MTELVHSHEDQLQARILIMEDLLRQVVEINVAATNRMYELDSKLNRIETILPALSNFIERSKTKLVDASTEREIADIKNRQEELHQELLSIPKRIEALLERATITTPGGLDGSDISVMDKLVNRIESQQSTILQTLEKRVDPRLMIYLKPLIEMLEEEGRQAEELKNIALQKLQYLISGKTPGSNEEISCVLQQVQQEIGRCTESFARTQQALQIVVIPFQNIGRIFRDNLEIVVQAHDLMAQLYDDLPRFLDEMKKRIPR